MLNINVPLWLLCFEYFANIAYVLFLRFCTNSLLFILVIFSSLLVINSSYSYSNSNDPYYFGILSNNNTYFNNISDIIQSNSHTNLKDNSNNYDLILSFFSLTKNEFFTGFIRLIFPFICGYLISRNNVKNKIKTFCPFLISSLLLIIICSIPNFENSKYNCLYECFCNFIVFPLILFISTNENIKINKNKNKSMRNIYKILGDISLPLSISHYPLFYCYNYWISKHKEEQLYVYFISFICFVICCICFAYFLCASYTIPFNKWINENLLVENKEYINDNINDNKEKYINKMKKD